MFLRLCVNLGVLTVLALIVAYVILQSVSTCPDGIEAVSSAFSSQCK